jgi:hypothetical protein
MQYINTAILITEMGVSNEAKNDIPLKFLRKIKNNFFSSCISGLQSVPNNPQPVQEQRMS